jgi:hypothetical protein
LLHEACRLAFVTGYHKEYVTATLGNTALDAEMFRFHFDLEWKPLLVDVRNFMDAYVPLGRTAACAMAAENPVQLLLHALLQLELFQRFSGDQQFVAAGMREIQRLALLRADSAGCTFERISSDKARAVDDETPQSSSFLFTASSERFTLTSGSPARSICADSESSSRVVFRNSVELLHLPLRLRLESDWKSQIVLQRRQRMMRFISSQQSTEKQQ